MEVGERLAYLPKCECLEVEGELLLAVTFAVLSQTGIHSLNYQNRQTRVAFQMYPEELHYTGMTQFGPSQTFRLKVADEFLRSSGRLVLEQNVVKAFRSAHGTSPIHLVHCGVRAYTELDVREHQVGYKQVGGSGHGRRRDPLRHFD